MSDWLAYYEVEPFGAEINDLRHGQMMALTANINRDTNARPEPFSAADFMTAPQKLPEAVPAEEKPAEISRRISTELFGM